LVGELSQFEISCITSFVKAGFNVKLWSYNNLSIPGVESCDASLVLPHEQLSLYKQKHHSGKDETSTAFSDAFRFNLIHKFGGWWFDADCFCLKTANDFYQLRKNCEFVAGLESNVHPFVGSAAFYANERCSALLVKELEKTCLEYNYSFPIWGMIGPRLITNFVHDNKLYDSILDQSHFFSIGVEECKLLTKTSASSNASSLIADSYVVHIWNSVVSTSTVEPGSLLDTLISNTYTNQETTNLNLSKQKNFYNRFIGISNLYHTILNRSPDLEGLHHYINGSHQLETIKNILLNSDEYKSAKHILRETMLSFLPSGTCAEIGVLEGDFSSFILQNNNPVELNLIDIWGNIELNYEDASMTDANTQSIIYNKVRSKFGSLPNVKIIRKLSTDATSLFVDDYFDWIYIDADHSFDGCYNDLIAYDSKVKADGYICGHDWLPAYFHRDGFGVNQAVLKFIEEKQYWLTLITEEYDYKSYVISKSQTAHDNLKIKMNSYRPNT
jgi:hypothetical protein